MKKLIVLIVISMLLIFPLQALAESIANLTNNSGGTRTSGDLVIMDTSADDSFTTTTTIFDGAMFGVIPYYRGGSSRTISDGARGPVQISGIVGIVCDEAMAKGDYVSPASVAGQGTGDAIEPMRYIGRVTKADASSPYIPNVLLNPQTKTWGFAGFTEFVEVAKGGKEFSVIQTAIDSITDNATGKRYAVLIYPGAYTENVVMEEYVSLVGVGGHEVTRITSASGTTVTAPSGGGEAAIIGLEIESTPTADNAIGVLHTTGELDIYDSYLTMTSATADAEGTLIDLNGGALHIFDSKLAYDFDGSGAGAATHYIIDVAGSATYNITGSEVEFDVADVDDTVVGFNEASGSTAEIFVSDCRMELGLSHASYAGVAGMFYVHSTNVSKEIMASHIRVTSSGGTGDTGYIFYMDTSAGGGVLNSIGNHGIITGFEFNYGVNVATGDTINAYFVALTAAQGATGAGTFNYISSTTAGALGLTGALTVGGVGTFTDDVAAPSGIFASASFPSSPADGEIFYHTTHDTLFQYENSKWNPIINYGATLALYVDDGAGTDAIGKGYGSGADAVATIQYAWDSLIPAIFNGVITINVEGATYVEELIFSGKTPGSSTAEIILLGELTTLHSGTADADSTTSVLEDDGNPWGGGPEVGNLLILTAGTGAGIEKFIRLDDADSLTPAGLFSTAPAADTDFTIYSLPTIIAPGAGNIGLTLINQASVTVKYIEFSAGQHGVYAEEGSRNIAITSCEIDTTTGDSIKLETDASVAINTAYIHACAGNAVRLTKAVATVNDAYILGCNTSNNANSGGVKLLRSAIALFFRCYIDGNNRHGVLNQWNSSIQFAGGANASTITNHNTAGDVGVKSSYVSTGNAVVGQTYPVGTNDDDEDADAATFAVHT